MLEKFQRSASPGTKARTAVDVSPLWEGGLRESMGNVFNYPTEPAPNEQYLWVQRPAACNEAGCDWVPNTPMMPHVANALSVPEWTTFMNRVTLCVNDFDQKISSQMCLILGISIPLGVAIGITIQFVTDNRVPLGGSPVIPILAVAFYFHNKRLKKNQAVDRQIQEVIGGVAPGWAARGVTVMYHTMFTGLCKPKHAQATRLLKIAVTGPPAGLELGNMQGYGASPQVMAVTLPQNCIPGHVLQVQAPNGAVISVTVPAGGMPGQILQVPALMTLVVCLLENEING